MGARDVMRALVEAGALPADLPFGLAMELDWIGVRDSRPAPRGVPVVTRETVVAFRKREDI
jgi:hypothetical protein